MARIKRYQDMQTDDRFDEREVIECDRGQYVRVDELAPYIRALLDGPDQAGKDRAGMDVITFERARAALLELLQ